MNYCSFITDLIIILGVKLDLLSLIANDNRSRFLKVVLLFLVEIIADILDNHSIFVKVIFIYFSRTFFCIWRYNKFSIRCSKVFLIVMLMLRMITTAVTTPVAVTMLTG
jgi:hypothetical protein